MPLTEECEDDQCPEHPDGRGVEEACFPCALFLLSAERQRAERAEAERDYWHSQGCTGVGTVPFVCDRESWDGIVGGAARALHSNMRRMVRAALRTKKPPAPAGG